MNLLNPIQYNYDHLRLLAFGITIVLLIFFEWKSPKIKLQQSRLIRWTSHFLLSGLNQFMIKIIFTFSAVDISLFSQISKRGIFHSSYFERIPDFIIVIISFFILDLVIYFQHRMFHLIPYFWRFHKVHHADLELDLTTGFRFHPIEIIFSLLLKMAVIYLLGIPILAVIIFEILLNSLSMFNHSNLQPAKKWDHIIRKLIVTPDMHRIHHSIESANMKMNFGFCFSFWDKWFSTYREYVDSHNKSHTTGSSHDLEIQVFANSSSEMELIIGLKEYRLPKFLWIHWLILLPFIRIKTS